MLSIKTFIAASLVALGMAGAATAQEEIQHFQVKVGVSAILPEEKASIATIGGDVNISNEYVPTLQLEYYFTNNISAELLCCMARHDVVAENTALGRVDLGKVSHFPPTLTAKYHWTNFGQVEPYLGVGVNYSRFFDNKAPSSGPVTSVSYKSSTGPALQAGLDYRLDKHWSLNFDVRKIWIKTDVDVRAGATDIPAKVDVNPWVVTVGTGYRF
jgi:outer membrane protein